ncbi:MAG: DNA/RNA non-specific endonuclease [Cytophagales bacterium]|nr:DNA/RNA non-specific endonuclease [Cytophagales bacterium]
MDRTGYDPNFLGEGIKVRPPKFSPRIDGVVFRGDELRDGIYLDYIHYSIVMNKKTRQLLYAASNIDQDNWMKYKRHSDDWNLDSRMPEELQLDNNYYKGVENPYDRGHLVRRANNCWAVPKTKENVKKANDDTFFYTNASLQHQYFNQDEWLALEDMFLNWELGKNGKLCILTGPVHRPFDRCFHRTWDDAARIPSAFFKIICYIGIESDKLETRAFLLYQDEEFTNNYRNGKKYVATNRFAKYQVSIADIENLTGLEFDSALPDSNPIYFNTPEDPNAVNRVYRYPERVPIVIKQDLVHNILANRETQEAKEEDKNLVIVAAMVNPEGRDSKKNEWVSLLNVSNDKIDLDGWALWNSRGKTAPLSGTVEAGESIRISFAKHDFSLVNADVHLILRNPKKDTVDIVSYTRKEAEESGHAIVFR